MPFESVRAKTWLPLALLGAVALVVVIPWFHAPLNYDEAYNLQVVKNLVEGHGYATGGLMNGGHRVPFDSRVTTGPTLLFPVAAVAAVAGDHLWVCRLVPILVTLSLVVAWFTIVRRNWGAAAAVAAVLAFLMLDNAAFLGIDRFGPGSVIGENASVLFLVLSALSLNRPWKAGLLVGLAVMTKVVVILAIPGLAVGVLLAARRDRRPELGSLVRFGTAVGGPTLCWQVYRFVDLGPAGAWRANREFLHFFLTTGGSGSASSSLPERVLAQLAVLGAPGMVAFLLAVALLGVTLRQQSVRPLRSVPPDLVAIAVAGLTLELWWLLLEGQGWVRHSTQATELLVPLLAGAAARGLQRRSHTPARAVMMVSLPVLAAAQIAVATYDGWAPPGPSLQDQRIVAQEISTRTDSFVLPHSWLESELTMLAPLTARPVGPSGGVMVLTGMWGPARPTEQCDRLLYEHAGYVVCRVDPTP
jgi:4-amino-4-deoxy-L-arabinose transferase-like glycosyltransferase